MSARAADTVLGVSDLHKVFRVGVRGRPVAALSGVTFAVRRGEIFGFLGPNGAGKTTTIKAIFGLIRPDSGSISLLGGDARDRRRRVRVGFLPEQAYYHEYLTAREFLTFHGELCGISPAPLTRRTDDLLARVGLTHAADRHLRKFSKGMLQRVGLAQALIAEPELVILDEPMSGLDPIGRRDVRDLLLALRSAGTTVFFSTHILPDVELMCDRVAILHHGRSVAEGPIDELAAAPHGLVDLQITGVDAARLAGIADLGCTFAPTGPYLQTSIPDDRVYDVLDKLRPLHARIVRMEARRRSLEEIFLQVLRLGDGVDAAAREE